MAMPECFKPFSELTAEEKEIVLDRARRYGVTGYRRRDSSYEVFSPSGLNGTIFVDPTHPTPEVIELHRKWMKAARSKKKV